MIGPHPAVRQSTERNRLREGRLFFSGDLTLKPTTERIVGRDNYLKRVARGGGEMAVTTANRQTLDLTIAF